MIITDASNVAMTKTTLAVDYSFSLFQKEFAKLHYWSKLRVTCAQVSTSNELSIFLLIAFHCESTSTLYIKCVTKKISVKVLTRPTSIRKNRDSTRPDPTNDSIHATQPTDRPDPRTTLDWDQSHPLNSGFSYFTV